MKQSVILADYTTFKVGGPAAELIEVTSTTELQSVVQETKRRGVPFRVLGGGSNVLVPDAGLSGVTIVNRLRGWTESEDTQSVAVTIGAGEILDKMIETCVEKGYWGLENLSHIPGSVGATPVQNVGAYGVEVANVISSVSVYDTQANTFIELDTTACDFGYRTSLFKQVKGEKYIVTAVTFALSRTPKPILSYRDLGEFFATESEPTLGAIREAVIAIRAKKFPNWHEVGTAGSFFKNPIISQKDFTRLKQTYPEMPGYEVSPTEVKIPLGWILDSVCNLRGFTMGNVATYQGQALVVVTNGKATATEIKNFADHVAQIVFDKTHIAIEWEVTSWL